MPMSPQICEPAAGAFAAVAKLSRFDESRPVIFTEHADEQGIERGISREDALYVLKNPVKTEPAERGCHNVWGNTASGKRIRVTINFDMNVIVTLANADRRLQ